MNGMQTVYTNNGRTLVEEMGMSHEYFGNNSSVVAPFDQEVKLIFVKFLICDEFNL